MKHSPEPWGYALDQQDIVSACAHLQDRSGDIVCRMESPVSLNVLGRKINRSVSNALRIEACVNALQGVPNELLTASRENQSNAVQLAFAVLRGEPEGPLIDCVLEQQQGELLPHRPYDEQIADIMTHFDFLKVHQAMKALGWQWASIQRTPLIHELKTEAERYLRDVAGKIGYSTGSGGFHAENTAGILRLSFVLEHWDGLLE